MSLLKDSSGDKSTKISLGLVAAVVIFLLVQTLGRANRVEGYDFTSYLLASRAFWHGLNPYLVSTDFPFIYPLPVCVLVYPLTLIPYNTAMSFGIFSVSPHSLILSIPFGGKRDLGENGS